MTSISAIHAFIHSFNSSFRLSHSRRGGRSWAKYSSLSLSQVNFQVGFSFHPGNVVLVGVLLSSLNEIAFLREAISMK
jgi:hypothetical protein